VHPYIKKDIDYIRKVIESFPANETVSKKALNGIDKKLKRYNGCLPLSDIILFSLEDLVQGPEIYNLFHYACRKAHPDIIKLFCSYLKAEDYDRASTEGGWIPLMHAIAGKQPIDVIQLLVEKGASVFWVTSSKQKNQSPLSITIFHALSQDGNTAEDDRKYAEEIAKFLIKHGMKEVISQRELISHKEVHTKFIYELFLKTIGPDIKNPNKEFLDNVFSKLKFDNEKEKGPILKDCKAELPSELNKFLARMLFELMQHQDESLIFQELKNLIKEQGKEGKAIVTKIVNAAIDSKDGKTLFHKACSLLKDTVIEGNGGNKNKHYIAVVRKLTEFVENSASDIISEILSSKNSAENAKLYQVKAKFKAHDLCKIMRDKKQDLILSELKKLTENAEEAQAIINAEIGQKDRATILLEARFLLNKAKEKEGNEDKVAHYTFVIEELSKLVEKRLEHFSVR